MTMSGFASIDICGWTIMAGQCSDSRKISINQTSLISWNVWQSMAANV